MNSGSWSSYRAAAELPDRDDEWPEVQVLSHATRRARKEHTCTGCGAAIPVGERYTCMAMIEDGVFQVWKVHTVCPYEVEEARKQEEAERPEIEEQNYEEARYLASHEGVTLTREMYQEEIRTGKTYQRRGPDVLLLGKEEGGTDDGGIFA